jgi:hypothetical protein
MQVGGDKIAIPGAQPRFFRPIPAQLSTGQNFLIVGNKYPPAEPAEPRPSDTFSPLLLKKTLADWLHLGKIHADAL